MTRWILLYLLVGVVIAELNHYHHSVNVGRTAGFSARDYLATVTLSPALLIPVGLFLAVRALWRNR